MSYKICHAVGELYASYSNIQSLPQTQLHKAAQDLAARPQAGAGGGQANASRARTWAWQAARGGHLVMQLPDVLFGTGVNRRGHVDVGTLQKSLAHLQDIALSPLDTGYLAFAALRATTYDATGGAFVGACLGQLCGASDERKLKLAEAAGAACAAPRIVANALASVLLGLCRLATGIAKFAVVGVLFGLGFGAGTLAQAASDAIARRRTATTSSAATPATTAPNFVDVGSTASPLQSYFLPVNA